MENQSVNMQHFIAGHLPSENDAFLLLVHGERVENIVVLINN